MARQINKVYGLSYKELVYSIWYTSNRPSIQRLSSMIPIDPENGDTPGSHTLILWYKNDAWVARADASDIELAKKTDRELIKVRMDMMKRHAKQARDIADKAFEYLQEQGYDSSASAVTAWVKSVEEEKKSTGMQIALTEVFALGDDDLKKKLDQLMGRLSNVGEVTIKRIDDGEDTIDAISTEEATFIE